MKRGPKIGFEGRRLIAIKICKQRDAKLSLPLLITGADLLSLSAWFQVTANKVVVN
jgi:hypothetical protein